MTRTRLAVLGSPIGHSKSPTLHRAAYDVLGVPWSYEAVEITSESLADYLASRNDEWRGLSLTMPLKHDVVSLLDRIDERGRAAEAANTVLFGDSGLSGFNTDVDGLVQPLVDAGVSHPSQVLVLGAGATAGSAVIAAGELGAASIIVAARNRTRAEAVLNVGRRVGAHVELIALEDVALARPDVVISTLPGVAADTVDFDAGVRQASVLFDVVYDPWPTTIATSWSDAGGRVIAGIEMLIAQALRQVRIFVAGDPDVPLEREALVLSAMRASVAAAG